jgi:hypothetical protein
LGSYRETLGKFPRGGRPFAEKFTVTKKFFTMGVKKRLKRGIKASKRL